VASNVFKVLVFLVFGAVAVGLVGVAGWRWYSFDPKMELEFHLAFTIFGCL